MRLPNAERARIPEEKIAEYLLSEEHATGRSKARYFRSLGFAKSESSVLRGALLEVAVSGSVTDRLRDAHGTRYVVDGTMDTPTGGTVEIRTVWMILKGERSPRLVTAYPL